MPRKPNPDKPRKKRGIRSLEVVDALACIDYLQDHHPHLLTLKPESIIEGWMFTYLPIVFQNEFAKHAPYIPVITPTRKCRVFPKGLRFTRLYHYSLALQTLDFLDIDHKYVTFIETKYLERTFNASAMSPETIQLAIYGFQQ